MKIYHTAPALSLCLLFGGSGQQITFCNASTLEANFDQSQKRDEDGKFADGGGSDSNVTKTPSSTDEKIEKQIHDYRKAGVPEDRLGKIRENLQKKAADEKANAQPDSPERSAVNRDVFNQLQTEYGSPDNSGRSEAAYFVTGDKYQIRVASHVPIHNRSSSHVSVVTSGESHPSHFHPDSVVVSTSGKSSGQVRSEINQGLDWHRGGRKGAKPDFHTNKSEVPA